MSWSDVLTATDRVREHTAGEAQASIDAELEQRLGNHGDADGDRIAARLEELDREWDIERVLEANAATVAALGITTSALARRRWMLLLPLAVALFLLQHAVQGWCPPLAVFRRRRVRSRQEIDLERYALKVLRGDFTNGKRPHDESVSEILQLVVRR
jgi:hypothetical protein